MSTKRLGAITGTTYIPHSAANENAKDWAMDTAVVTETVKAAEAFLRKYAEYLPKGIPSTEFSAIAEFLGGVFSESMVREALTIIHAIQKKLVDEKAVKAIKEPFKASEFVNGVACVAP